MVERLHRQIKTAIKCQETEAWREVLPVVMMGIRAAVKEDFHATPAELVYEETVRLPGEFLQGTTQTNETSDFLLRLRKTMSSLRPQPIKRHSSPAIFQHKDLTNTTHVFLRHDAPTRALQPTFDGPYKVLSKGKKVFKLLINGRTVHVTIDRLKPAYTLADQESSDKPRETPQPPQDTPADVPLMETTTRSGRVSRKTVRLQIPTSKQRRGLLGS
ncbi:uncharacterized protein LOC143897648 [Temnothorax americanus]|uniref:uncharacterized protein LOC143897648 n=1 Tax=Temnothorax americanus TaxID=1964332 RepID=UPI004067FE28